MAGFQESKRYWDEHPIGVEPFEAKIGTPEFFEQYQAYYDEFFSHKHRQFQYASYAGRDVLHIGCGLGSDSVNFARAGADITCIDLSDTAVDCTRRWLQYLGFPAKAYQGAAEDLRFPDESFDAVVATGVLPHVVDEERAISEMRRVLRPGGDVLAMLYHRWSWFWLLVKLTGTSVESELGDPPIIRVHSLRDARRMFRSFSRVEIEFDRLPKRTRRRRGALAALYNDVFVPLTEALPRSLIKRCGWHILVKATK